MPHILICEGVSRENFEGRNMYSNIQKTGIVSGLETGSHSKTTLNKCYGDMNLKETVPRQVI